MNKLIVCAGILAMAHGSNDARADSAQDIINTAGIHGGLVVHLGCGDGKLTAGLCLDDRYVVHGLDRSRDKVAAARAHLHEQGLYGKVSVEVLDSSRLPYGDNLVNLVVVADPSLASPAEIARVLCPRGVAVARTNGQWKTTVKPWPNEIDEWTHFLYDATGNAVGNDERVAPPRHLQWSAGPKRTRDHDALASFTTMTSSQGRVFYILDEGPTSQIHRQPQWKLVARDAFNGCLLWRKNIDSWVTHLYNFRVGPAQMTRRLVSVGDRVYVTLGYDAPISALDATSGRECLTFADSDNTEEIILHDDVLLSVQGDPKMFDAEAPKIDGYWETRRGGEPSVVKSLVAYQASTGKHLWTKTDSSMAYLVPLSLTAGDGNAYYLDHEHLCSVDLHTGETQWKAPYSSEGLFLRNYAPTVVLYQDVIVCLSIDKMAAFSATDGSRLWDKQQGYLGFASPGDLFIVNDLVWTFPGTAGIKYDAKDRILGNAGKEFWALDLYTGEVKHTIAKNDVWPGGHHHRCYRNKATQHFAVCGRRGLEFVDLTGGEKHVINWWVRGICQYGIMPCNGMVYVPPDPCRCFNTFKVDGLLALAATTSETTSPGEDDARLTSGPALGIRKPSDDGQKVTSDEWPTYRHDAARSGFSETTAPAKLARKWEADLNAELSAAVVAAGRVLLSAKRQNTVYCLDAETGQRLWKFTTGGPVDSPPTVVDGMAVFGSRDGHAYAVNLADGELAWRFRGGPCDRRIVSEGRLESAWPIHGSVLALDGIVYFAAGRSSFLDGGIHLYGLDLATGEKKYEALVNSQPAHDINSGALPDILVSDGSSIHMRQLTFDKQLQPVRKGGQGAFAAATGFLENEWGHRLAWNRSQATGNLLVFDSQTIYGAQSRYAGWKKNRANWPPTHTGHLHQKYSRYQPEWFPIGNRLFAQPPRAGKDARRKGPATSPGQRWTLDLPIQVRAMVLTRNTLFAAGWPDSVTILGQADPHASERELQDPTLWALAAKDGKTIATHKLEDLPVFDGTAAAYGCLFMPLQNGKVICFGE